ncbi:MAG: hypothetical protein ACRDK5_08965 [Solirubrobacterales bacterium]
MAGEEAGPGRPSYTNHRRAVSSAYYAAFHQVTAQVALQLFPDREAFQVQARRSVTHEAVRVVCQWLQHPDQAPQHLRSIADEVQQDQTVRHVAYSLIGLKEAREEADYDHTRPFNKLETLALLEDARATVDALRQGAAQLDAMMALIALKTSPR